MFHLFNTKFHKRVRQYLRNNATKAERILWSSLKGRQLLGIKFRRQHGIGPFIVDFYCPEYKLVIELDGPIHEFAEAREYDRQRQKYIEQYGIRFLRFTNDDVCDDLDTVLRKIAESTGQPQRPPLSP